MAAGEVESSQADPWDNFWGSDLVELNFKVHPSPFQAYTYLSSPSFGISASNLHPTLVKSCVRWFCRSLTVFLLNANYSVVDFSCHEW